MTITPAVGDIWVWRQKTSYVLICLRKSSTQGCYNFKAFDLAEKKFEIISVNDVNINGWRKLA